MLPRLLSLALLASLAAGQGSEPCSYDTSVSAYPYYKYNVPNQQSCPCGLTSHTKSSLGVAGQNCGCPSGYAPKTTQTSSGFTSFSTSCALVTCSDPQLVFAVDALSNVAVTNPPTNPPGVGAWNGPSWYFPRNYVATCAACASGTYGTPGTTAQGCTQCNKTKTGVFPATGTTLPTYPVFCPGATTTPIMDFPFGLPSEYTAVCPALAYNNSRTTKPKAVAAARWSSEYLTNWSAPDIVIVCGLVLMAAVTVFYITSHALTPVAEVFRMIDINSKAVWVPDGAPQMRMMRPVGGFFSLIGVLGFLTAALVLITQRVEDNVLSATAANILSIEAEQKVTKLNWKADEDWGQGIAVYIGVSGQPGTTGVASKCANPILTPPKGFSKLSSLQGAAAQTWGPPKVTTSCGDASASQIVFTCPGCSLAAGAQLVLTFDYSCQAFDIQVGAMAADGTLTVVKSDGTLSAGADGRRVSSVLFSTDIYYNVVNDTRLDSKGNLLMGYQGSYRGYQVSNGASFVNGAESGTSTGAALGQVKPENQFTSATRTIIKDTNNGLITTANGGGVAYYVADTDKAALHNKDNVGSIVPSMSPVTVTIKLNLNTMYSSTTLSEKTSIATLLAQIVGVISVVSIGTRLMNAHDMTVRVVSAHLNKKHDDLPTVAPKPAVI